MGQGYECTRDKMRDWHTYTILEKFANGVPRLPCGGRRGGGSREGRPAPRPAPARLSLFPSRSASLRPGFRLGGVANEEAVRDEGMPGSDIPARKSAAVAASIPGAGDEDEDDCADLEAIFERDER